VLHRDVKPDNILLTRNWRELAPAGVKLTDFGIASLIGERKGTTTGLVGTPEYMAPEQLLTGAADFPVDIYAAGILLYELLAGRTPFSGPGTGYAVAHRHVTSLPPRIPVPDPLWDVIAGMLDKDHGERPDAIGAADRLRKLRGGLAGVPALAGQPDPESFAAVGMRPTEVRGLQVPTSDATPASDATVEDGTGAAPAPAIPDLGTGGSETVLRSMPVVPTTPGSPATPAAPQRFKRLRRIGWRDPRVVAGLVTLAVLIGLGVYWLADHRATPVTGPSTQPSSMPVQQQSQPSATGLGISRTARWDANSRKIQLQIVYSAQRAPLQGPYLEVMPDQPGAAGCPDVTWQGASAQRNLSSVTGIEAACGWSITPEAILARGNVTVTASVAVDLNGSDPNGALQQWLASASDATQKATSDSQTTTTAYPAQRLTDIQVMAPSRTVSGKTLRIVLLPVWPSGTDQLDPLFVSPPSGKPATTLVAIAGGTSGVRFGDGCSGALSISNDGLVVTAQSPADSCEVNADVGNFTDLKSNSFSITTRGS
jgi:serine/threonine-protein kinase